MDFLAFVMPWTDRRGRRASDVVDGPRAVPDRKEARMSVMVGHEAPDFEAPGLQHGKFGKFKLSDYKGKWVVICFYPGDFTFV
jgi:peroxiredoxin (alkyl hydroperoxide reductase subunit C)